MIVDYFHITESVFCRLFTRFVFSCLISLSLLSHFFEPLCLFLFLFKLCDFFAFLILMSHITCDEKLRSIIYS